jgi:hypothetical protein
VGDVRFTTDDWNDEQEIRLAHLLQAEYGGESLTEYILRVSPRHAPPRHLSPILNLWERTRRERVFACVEVPPRHAKTTTGLHALAWRLHRDPALTHGFATFGDDYAASRSRICRVMARAGGVDIPRGMANLHEWGTPHGGSVQFRGYQGEWTGRGITGVALLDDLYKDRAQAESAKVRENIWDWFTDVLWTRLEDRSSVICQFTRWHDDDLIGRLLQGKFKGYRFEEVRLPAICEDEDDLVGREIGEALWPEKVSAEELRRIEVSVGPYTWAALFQQRPRPKGADVFQDPGRFSLRDWKPDGHRILLCCDPAATDDNRADFSAAFILAAKGYGDDMVVWILHGWRDHVTVPAVARKLLEISEHYWRAPVAVEAVGAFKGVPQTLKEIQGQLGRRIIEIRPLGDKFTRAQAVAAAWNTGRVLVPVDAECTWNHAKYRFLAPKTPMKLRAGVPHGITWADELIKEAGKFTGINDPEDDQIDALAHGYNHLHQAGKPTKGTTKQRAGFG